MKSKTRSPKKSEEGRGTKQRKPSAATSSTARTVRTEPQPSKAAISTYYTKQDNDFYDLAASELTPSEERLYQRLYRRSWGYQKNSCSVSILDLAQLVKTDPRQIRRLRDALLKKGWIEILTSRIESIASKKPLEYRVYSAREILAKRTSPAARSEIFEALVDGDQGQVDPGHFDPGQDARGNIAANLSQECPSNPPRADDNNLITNVKSEAPQTLKKEEERKEIISPLTPPTGGRGGQSSIPPEIIMQAEELTDQFYTTMQWTQQTERIRQSDIASIVHWHHYEGFDFNVIQRALAEVAKKADTRSLKRAEYYLAPLARNGTATPATDERRMREFEEEARQKEERIAKLKNIKQKMTEDDFNELYQNHFDDLQAENPSLPLFILETLARQKAHQALLEEYKE